ncbi:MAG: FHA domain-containing protein [Bdellovibrionaceae bacterium]|nr:FHA domain-containing protein [Bdellovibrionales bacterium]MCB9255458.1 FHA domain-containing protein [Pseudobdellovibrionaceae bacterium]
MSKHSLVADNQGVSFLEQVVGPGKGRVFEMVAQSLTIGRSDDNDIVIPSNSVSRNHALVEIQEGGHVTIRDNGSKNGILVNGNLVRESPLANGDIVQVGDFAFRFNNPMAAEPIAAPAAAVAVAPAAEIGLGSIGLGGGKTKIKGPPSRRPLIYGVAALVIGGMYFLQEPDPNAPVKEAIKAKIEQSAPTSEITKRPYLENLDPTKAKDPTVGIGGLDDPAKSSAEIALEKMDFKSDSAKEAEQYFRKGRREYLNHSLQRAIQFFKTALTFDRGHGLAQFYLQLSIAEAEKEASKHFEMGVKYFDSLQYERAIYHFTQVQQMLAHRPNHEMVPKARKYIAVGQTRLRAAELYP